MIRNESNNKRYVQFHPIVNGKVDYKKGLVSTEGKATTQGNCLEIISQHTQYCYELMTESPEKYINTKLDIKIW